MVRVELDQERLQHAASPAAVHLDVRDGIGVQPGRGRVQGRKQAVERPDKLGFPVTPHTPMQRLETAKTCVARQKPPGMIVMIMQLQ